jgi:hypothetical protein
MAAASLATSACIEQDEIRRVGLLPVREEGRFAFGARRDQPAEHVNAHARLRAETALPFRR